MQEWAKTAPIQNDLAFISKQLEAFQTQANTIDNVKLLINQCKGRLQNMKEIMGSTDEFYLKISSAVVANALGMVIEIVNKAQSGLQQNRSKLLLLPNIVSNAVSALNSMRSFDMDAPTKKRYSQNKSSIKDMDRQLESVKSLIGPTHSSPYTTQSTEEDGAWWKWIAWCAFILYILYILVS